MTNDINDDNQNNNNNDNTISDGTPDISSNNAEGNRGSTDLSNNINDSNGNNNLNNDDATVAAVAATTNGNDNIGGEDGSRDMTNNNCNNNDNNAGGEAADTAEEYSEEELYLKQKFYEVMNEKFQNKRNIIIDDDQYSKNLSLLRNWVPNLPNRPDAEYKVQKKYVVVVGSHDTALRLRPSDGNIDNANLKVTTLERMFDIIHKVHKK